VIHRMRGVAMLALLTAALMVSAGCRAAESPAPEQPVSARPVATITAMSPDHKRSLIASSFPVEAPAALGDVVSGEAQGESAWDYEVLVKGSVEDVALWYRAAYAGRSWQLAEQTSPTPESVVMTFGKGTAQSRVAVEPGAGGRSRVSVVLGVGTEVLQTQ